MEMNEVWMHVGLILLVLVYWGYHYYKYKQTNNKITNISRYECVKIDFDLLYKHYIHFNTEKLKIIKDKLRTLEPEKNNPFLGYWLTLMVLLFTIIMNIITIITNIITPIIDKVPLDAIQDILLDDHQGLWAKYNHLFILVFVAFLNLYFVFIINSFYSDRIHKSIKAHLIVIENILDKRNTFLHQKNKETRNRKS